MYSHFDQSKNIFLSGCGGGYDLFCGLDLYFNLISKELNKKVILGSLSFTNDKLLKKVGTKISNCCFRIDSTTQFNESEYIKDLIQIQVPPDYVLEQMHYTKDEYISMHANLNKFCDSNGDPSCYFPEYKLIQSLKKNYGISCVVYCFTLSSNQGIKHLTEAYNHIIDIENIDTIVLMDGGTDSLMTGIEIEKETGKSLLGTPFEDVSSIIAVSNSKCDRNYLYCLGYNVDRYHDVTDENFLKNTSELIKDNYFIGSYMLNKKNDSTKKYITTFMECNPENSIVNSHVILSLQGVFGDVCPEWLKHRIGSSKQYIHPLMALYWMYDLKGIYAKLSYDVNALKETIGEYEIAQLLKIDI